MSCLSKPTRKRGSPSLCLLQGLIEPAIEYATESGAFDHALELAQACCPAKLSGIHLKHALFLEDEERFKEVSPPVIPPAFRRDHVFLEEGGRGSG